MVNNIKIVDNSQVIYNEIMGSYITPCLAPCDEILPL